MKRFKGIKRLSLTASILLTVYCLHTPGDKKEVKSEHPIPMRETNLTPARVEELEANFQKLKQRVADRRILANELSVSVSALKEANDAVQTLEERKTAIVSNRPLKNGQILLTEDEAVEIENINEVEIQHQSAMLSQLNSLKELSK